MNSVKVSAVVLLLGGMLNAFLCVAQEADFSGQMVQGGQPAQSAPLVWKEPPLADYGISTTLEEGRGNWYMKKQQTKVAFEVQQRIGQLADALASRQSSLDEVSALVEGQLAEFFATAGFAPGELDERLTLIIQQIEKGGSQKGLSEKDRAMIAEIDMRKKEVADVRADLELLKRLSNVVAETVRLAQSEMSKAERYRKEAGDLYDAIDETISDEKADRLLAMMRSFVQNLELVEQYITRDIAQYFDQIRASISQTILSIQKKIADLKAKGLSLEKKVQDEGAVQKPKPTPPPPPKAWYQNVFDGVQGFFARIWDSIFGAIRAAFGFLGIKI